MSPRKDGVMEINDCAGKKTVFKFTQDGHLKNIKEDKCVGATKDSFDLRLEKCKGNAEDQMFELKDKKFHLKGLPSMCIDVEGMYQSHSGKILQVSACSFASKVSDQLWE